jgi:hypothetical protein
MELDAFGFFQASGAFALEKRTETFQLNDGVISEDPTKAKKATEITTDLLTIGGSGIDAFAGINGGTDNAIGLNLTEVDFGLALMTEVLAEGSTATARSFSTLKANAGSVSFIGIDDLTASATDLSVEINRGIPGTVATPDLVVDHGGRQLDVLAGPDSTITLDADGSLGELTRASGQLELNVFNFVTLQGFLSLEKSSKTVTLQAVGTDDAVQVAVDALTVGGKGVSAFVGVNGGYDEEGALNAEAKGLALSNSEFALALLSSKADATRTWTSLQATAGALSFVGIEGLTAKASDISVAINKANKADANGLAVDQVVDYAGAGATALAVKTGTDSSKTFSLEGSEGKQIKAAANLDIDLFGFFSVKGGVAVEQRSQNVTLSDGSTIQSADLITIGGNRLDAFAGVNGGYDDTTGLLASDAVGLSLGQVNFGLALIDDPKDATRSFTSLQATAASAEVKGIAGLTVKVQDLLVNINQGITLAAEQAQSIKVNTQLKLEVPQDLVGTLSFSQTANAVAGYAADSATVTIGQTSTNADITAALTAALESLEGIGAGNVSVTGNRAEGYTLEFIGTLSGKNIADLSVSATPATITTSQSTQAQANAGVNEVKQVTLQALREAPAPVTVTIGTDTQGLAGVNERNEIIFTSPNTAGNYTVFLVADGIVLQTTAGVEGLSELQRLSLTGDTTATPSTVTASVTTLAQGNASAKVNEGYQITFKKQFGYQGFKLYFVDNPVLSTTWDYRNNAENTSETIAQLKAAYAQLLNGYAGKTVTTADISVSVDTSYSKTGNRYNVSFIGNLAGINVKGIGMRSEADSFSNVNTRNGVSGESEIQRVLVKSAAAGSFTLSLTHNSQTYTTTGINYGANAATVRYALNAALGSAGNVEVTGTATDGYQITFGGALSGTNLADLVVSTSQSAPSGSFTLSYNGQTTSAINYSTDGAKLAKAVQTALSALSTIGAGNMAVSYNAGQSTSDLLGLDIRFTGSLANSNAAQISVNATGLSNAAASMRTIAAGVSNTNQVQTVTLGTDAQTDGYTLSLTYLGQSYSTALIAGNASQAQIQSAVNAAFGQIAGAQFTVSKTGANVAISASGSLSGQNLNLINLQAKGALASGSSITKGFVVGNTTQNAANLKAAFAELLNTDAANISVSYDSSYRAGQRYVLSFVGALAGTDIADKGISVAGTQVAYKLLADGQAGVGEVQTISIDRDTTPARPTPALISPWAQTRPWCKPPCGQPRPATTALWVLWARSRSRAALMLIAQALPAP